MANLAMSQMEKLSSPIVMRARPLFIFCATTTRCNLRCTMCPREHFEQTGDIPLDLVQSLQPAFRRAMLVFLHGIGEPLLHREFHKIVALGGKTGVAMALNTNGTMLTDDRVKCLVENAVNYVTVSIDAASEPLYSSIRRGANLQNVLERVERLNREKIKACSRWPKLAFEFVLMKKNADELPGLVRLARRHNVGIIRVIDLILHHHDDPGIDRSWAAQSVGDKPELTMRAFARAEQLAREAGVTLALPERYKNGHGSNGNTEARPSLCLEPWETVYVNYDGRVFPCCASTMQMGDLNTQSLDDIWNGGPYKELRGALKSGSIPEDCKKCSSKRTRSRTYRGLIGRRLRAAFKPIRR